MITSIAEAYGWTLNKILDLTIPQIILVNHAAFINNKRFELRIKKDRSPSVNAGVDYNPVDKSGNPRQLTVKEKYGDDPIIMGDKKLSEISNNFDALSKYLAI